MYFNGRIQSFYINVLPVLFILFLPSYFMFIIYFTLLFSFVHFPYFCSNYKIAIPVSSLVWNFFLLIFLGKIRPGYQEFCFGMSSLRYLRNVNWRDRAGSWVCAYTPLSSYIFMLYYCMWGIRPGGTGGDLGACF